MKNKKDNLGDRIKSNYEDAYRINLPKRMPVIIRLDGCHFSSYTKGCQKPWDQSLIQVFNETTAYLCKNIHGCKLGYTQSDEISLLITNYDQLNTQSYFDNNLQKMVSVAASLASSYFTSVSNLIFGRTKLAQFDARAFVLPKEEVNNAFIFRQNDAMRNSVQMLGRSLYSHKELNGKNSSQIKEMTSAKGKPWENLPISEQRGRCIVKETYLKDNTTRSRWTVDNNIPIFSKEPDYINNYVCLKSLDEKAH